MRTTKPGLVLGAAATIYLLFASLATADDTQWISLFDGKSLVGWEKVGGEASVWEVKEGTLRGSGPASMLVCTKGPYKNFRYRAEIKINDGGNSGLYFRTTAKPSFTDGYEAQAAAELLDISPSTLKTKREFDPAMFLDAFHRPARHH